MKEQIGLGKNVEQAIENALFEIGVSRDDVDIKILDAGGFLRKAKVCVTISAEAKSKYPQYAEKEEPIKRKELPPQAEQLAVTHTFLNKNAENNQETLEEFIPKVYPPLEKEKREKIEKAGTEFLENAFKAVEVKGKIVCEETEGAVCFSVTGEGLEVMIGYRGNALNAWQSIMLSYVQKIVGHGVRLRLDIGNYCKRRENSLIELAQKVAEKVARTGNSAKLDNMPANERRIIHKALQNSTSVSTISKGTEPRRFLIILPKKENA
ncbi:MAG: RNA-binding cell elongation regulator Jag/EloR [Clostridia bacterium]